MQRHGGAGSWECRVAHPWTWVTRQVCGLDACARCVYSLYGTSPLYDGFAPPIDDARSDRHAVCPRVGRDVRALRSIQCDCRVAPQSFQHHSESCSCFSDGIPFETQTGLCLSETGRWLLGSTSSETSFSCAVYAGNKSGAGFQEPSSGLSLSAPSPGLRPRSRPGVCGCRPARQAPRERDLHPQGGFRVGGRPTFPSRVISMLCTAYSGPSHAEQNRTCYIPPSSLLRHSE